jgi:hypothetical protein
LDPAGTPLAEEITAGGGKFRKLIFFWGIGAVVEHTNLTAVCFNSKGVRRSTVQRVQVAVAIKESVRHIHALIPVFS